MQAYFLPSLYINKRFLIYITLNHEESQSNIPFRHTQTGSTFSTEHHIFIHCMIPWLQPLFHVQIFSVFSIQRLNIFMQGQDEFLSLAGMNPKDVTEWSTHIVQEKDFHKIAASKINNQDMNLLKNTISTIHQIIFQIW